MMPDGVLIKYWKKSLQEEWAAYYRDFYTDAEIDVLGAAITAEQQAMHDGYINQVLIPIMGQHGWQRTTSGGWITRESQEGNG